VLAHVNARFFPPTVSGIAPPAPPGVFRIDHDENLGQTTHLQYQPFKRAPWFGFNCVVSQLGHSLRWQGSYAPRHRAEWLGKISEPGVRRRAEFFYQQLDAMGLLRQEVRRDLLAEAKKHQAWKLLRQIPGIGPIRAAVLMAVMQTPHRFRTKRQLWNYSGLGLETHDSGEYRAVKGQLQRVKKQATVRGLNKDHNHDLKDIFKGAAMRTNTAAGPLHDFYENLLAKGRNRKSPGLEMQGRRRLLRSKRHHRLERSPARTMEAPFAG
jgi:Transposase IS116/IS110/IS902 family